jgi:hypothetical protein
VYNDPNVQMEVAAHAGDVPVIKDKNLRYPAVSNAMEFRYLNFN